MNSLKTTNNHISDRCAASRRSTTSVTIIVLLALLLVAVSTASANPPSKDPKEYNDRINERFSELNDSLKNLVDKAVNENGGLFTDAQKEHLKNERMRAAKAQNRTHEAGGFKKWAKKQKLECFILEIIGDGIGDDIQPCEKGEICEEIIDDLIGDEDGECWYKFCGKKNGEICAENCNEDLIEDMNDNYDPNAAQDIEDSIVDVTAVLDDTNDLLTMRLERMAAMKLSTVPLVQSLDPNDKCARLPVDREREFDFTTLQGMLAGANAASMAYNICDSACNQDAFGWNCSAVCVVLATAEGVLETISDAFELQDDTVTAEQVDAACLCLKQTSAEIGDIQEEILLLKAQIQYLTDLVNQRFDDMEVLLNTPQGRRPDFPIPAEKDSTK